MKTGINMEDKIHTLNTKYISHIEYGLGFIRVYTIHEPNACFFTKSIVFDHVRETATLTLL